MFREGYKITLEELKNSIQQETTGDELVIFLYEDEPFIPNQYIKEISRFKNKSVEYIESLESVVSSYVDIFGTKTSNDGLRVFKSEKIETLSDKLKTEKDLFIVTSKIEDKDALNSFTDYIVKVPKLEGWQLQDYMYSVAEGVNTKSLDWLIQASGNDIYRLENELDKFRLFEESERNYLFDDMLLEGAFRDISSFNVFNITNAVTSRDYVTLKNAMLEIKSFDAEPLGIVTLLYQGFKKLIQVWLAKNPTPESTGLKSNVIYAINKQPKCFTPQQLTSAFLLLTDIDRRLKTGDIDIKWLVDYIICRVLTY